MTHLKNKLLFLSLITFAAIHAQSLTSNYHWLIGRWEMKAGNNLIYEEWTIKNDSTFLGTSYLLNSKGVKKIMETMEFRTRNGVSSYVPTVIGQNDNEAVIFEIKTTEKNKFTAENQTHDFPKRISYELKKTNELYAKIEGSKNGKTRKEEWIFKK